MTASEPHHNATEPESPAATHGAPLPLQQNKVVLVVDLVESVRLMASNEAAVVGHWHRFMQHAQAVVLPQRQGRLVKSLGDGLLAEFSSASQGVRAALDLHRFFNTVNTALPDDQQLHLRAGLNGTHLYVDARDVYGHGVNLAARVASLAGPGETVVTANIRDGIVDGATSSTGPNRCAPGACGQPTAPEWSPSSRRCHPRRKTCARPSLSSRWTAAPASMSTR
jgi:adenylate cyclase